MAAARQKKNQGENSSHQSRTYTRSTGRRGTQVCRPKRRDSDSAVSGSGSLKKGGGGVGLDESNLDIAARLISPRPDEKLALQAIRHRASNGTSCTTTAQLAVDLRTTRERAGHLIDRLHRKGWIVTDCRRVHWLPTSMAGLAYSMLDVEKLVRGLAELHGCSFPARHRPLLTLARAIWSCTGPENGYMPHPVASPQRSWLRRDEPARRRGLAHWWNLRRRTRVDWARDQALRELAKLAAA